MEGAYKLIKMRKKTFYVYLTFPCTK